MYFSQKNNLKMGWSKVNSKYDKPFKWWFHKILCEYGWLISESDNFATYHFHLKKCHDLGFNIYGDKI